MEAHRQNGRRLKPATAVGLDHVVIGKVGPRFATGSRRLFFRAAASRAYLELGFYLRGGSRDGFTRM